MLDFLLERLLPTTWSGGFGSKVSGTITMAIPALLAKKANAPVMMRINQEEEHYIGRVRPAFHGRVKIGFAKDGRIQALDGRAGAERRRRRSFRVRADRAP